MRCLILFLFAICLSAASSHKKGAVKKFQLTGFAQGTTYQISYYSTDSTVTKKQVDSILDRIDSSLSIYKSYSLINQFNNSESGIEADEHFIAVVKKSVEAHKHTGGIFDITIQPLVQAWGFGAKPVKGLPDSGTIQSLKKCVGSGMLQVYGNKIVKKKSCVKIDVNGIAQGYSVDVLANFFEKNHIHNYMVELGGEIRVKGRKQPGNEKMKIGIEAPGYDEYKPALMQKIIILDSGAITTSGNYRRYYESAGKMISHILDARTGYSVQNELISVTVYAKEAIIADAYDNALMVMGLNKALQFVEKNKEIAAHFIYKKNNGVIADTASSRFYNLLRE